MITACERKCPFVIGLYYGKRKPTDLEFLNEFVADYQNVEQNGIQVQGEKLTVVMTAIICDAPARAMVKNIKGHSGYSGCERCVQRGVYINKVTFPETEADHRTDQSFRNMLDENHHLGETPLSQLSLGMVSNFPLDYMHLVCLGVTRRLVKLWLKGPLKTRQSPQLIREISAKLQSLNGALPREFARQPRSLNEFERWKATELRQFLLYTGPVVLYRIIPKPFYENFMLLSVAMFIYLSPFNCSSYSQLGHQLIVTFIKHYATLYGNDMITYNVHGLVHLKEDVQQYGALDNVSCFPFESYLGQIKRMVRNANYPLQQVIRRLSENHVAFPTKSKELFEQPHNGGQIPETMWETRVCSNLKYPGKICPYSSEEKLCGSATQTFLVVAFAGEDGVGVIPSQWRTGERECFWPPHKSSTRFEKAVKSVEAPQASWTRHTIRVLSTTGSYARAMILLTRAEETSDLATENEDERPSKRRKLQNRRYVSSSDDTEEEAENFSLPPPIQPLVPLTTPLTSNINPQSQRQNFPDAVVSPISARHSTGSTQSLAGSTTQKKILMILAEIKAEVRDLKRQTVANSHLIQSLKTSHLDLEELPDDVNLPLSSVPLLTALDELARTDFNVEKRLPTTSPMLSNSHSNAEQERLLSVVRKNKTDSRLSLKLDGTLSSILAMKLQYPESTVPCFKWKPTKETL
ncbi:hypothetical protein BSL78_26353 [Apostichopus japonicus]|uniref:Transposase domain-containing protein n=1 Tax=Stichopus japonicus TaxID=307972 RepID=A0A2G8JM32_STIJA|nr:hypothetical protein BSL78_26353 [Apostichopus japonicus]